MASFAYAAHHLLSTFTNIVEGNQQTAQMMRDDVLRHPLPITHGPDWGVPEGAGLGIEVDCEKVGLYMNAIASEASSLRTTPL